MENRLTEAVADPEPAVVLAVLGVEGVDELVLAGVEGVVGPSLLDPAAAAAAAAAAADPAALLPAALLPAAAAAATAEAGVVDLGAGVGDCLLGAFGAGELGALGLGPGTRTTFLAGGGGGFNAIRTFFPTWAAGGGGDWTASTSTFWTCTDGGGGACACTSTFFTGTSWTSACMSAIGQCQWSTLTRARCLGFCLFSYPTKTTIPQHSTKAGLGVLDSMLSPTCTFSPDA